MQAIRVGLFCRVLPRYRLAIYEELAKRPEIDLTVIYSKEPPYYSLKTVDPDGRFKSELIEMRAWRFGTQELLYQPDANRLIKSGRFDVVILPGNPRLLSNFPSLYSAKRRKIGIVWWSLGSMVNQSPITMAIRCWLMQIPNSILLYTKDEKDFFISKGLPSEKVFVAQNTISVEAEIEAANKWTSNKLKNFVNKNGLGGKNLFLFCARLRPVKRIDLLLHAVSCLLKDKSNIHLIIIGEGESETELKDLAAKLNLNGNVSWLGSLYDPEKLAPWYLSSKALVIPTGIGLAAFQSFAYGLPCITTSNKRKQSPEFVALRDGYNSLTFENDIVEDLAEKMRLIIIDSKLQQMLSMNARWTMEKEYTVDKMVNGFCEAIKYAWNQVSLDKRQSI